MLMNKKQRIIIIIGVGIILLMGLIPPWKCAFSVPRLPHLERLAGYGFIFYPPSPVGVVRSGEFGESIISNPSYWSVRPDITRLFIQWVVVAIAVAGICLFLKEDEKGSR
jgi:hypothetical protein